MEGIKVEYHEVPLGHDQQEETNSLGHKGAREGIYPLGPIAIDKGTFKGVVDICREKEWKIELVVKCRHARKKLGRNIP